MLFPSSITFAGGPGRDGIIDFTPGSELLITKAKNGHLAVVSGNTDQGKVCHPALYATARAREGLLELHGAEGTRMAVCACGKIRVVSGTLGGQKLTLTHREQLASASHSTLWLIP